MVLGQHRVTMPDTVTTSSLGLFYKIQLAKAKKIENIKDSSHLVQQCDLWEKLRH